MPSSSATPTRSGGTSAIIVGAPAASRRGRGLGTRVLGNTLDAPASSTGPPVLSVCSKGDVVCDLRGNPAGKAVAMHLGYGSGAGAAAVASAARRCGRGSPPGRAPR